MYSDNLVLFPGRVLETLRVDTTQELIRPNLEWRIRYSLALQRLTTHWLTTANLELHPDVVVNLDNALE